MRHLFTCAVCQRPVECWGFNQGADKQVEPVCRYCEREYGRKTKLPDGSIMDRRKAVQIKALAEALHTEAAHIKWNVRYG